MPLPDLAALLSAAPSTGRRVLSVGKTTSSDEYVALCDLRVVMLDGIYRCATNALYISAGGGDFLVNAGDVFSLQGLALNEILIRPVVSGANGTLTAFGSVVA